MAVRSVLTLLMVISLWLVNGFATAADLLRVGVVQAAPFASQFGDEYQGLAIDLWEQIAADNHWAFRYLSASSDADQAIQQLYAGRYDVLIGPISVNRSRLIKVDFSRAFFINRMGVILPKQASHFFNIFDNSLTRPFIAITIALVLAFFIYLHLFWYFERGKHPEISESYWKAISDSLWLHIIKKGFGSMPTTVYGKFTILFWVICVGLFFTSFNASVTSVLTVALAKEYDSIKSLSNLQHLQLAVVEGSAAKSLVQAEGLVFTNTQSLSDAINLLQKKKVGAIVYDSVIAQNYLMTHKLTDLMMSDFALAQKEYAFAVPYHSALRQAINMSLVELQDAQEVSAICQKYLGVQQAKYCQL